MRRRQIGALRALGAPRGPVFTIVWLEVFAVSGAGILGGFALGRAAASVLARIAGAASGVGLPVEFRSEDLLSLLALLAVAGVATLGPALLAYRQSPATALRN